MKMLISGGNGFLGSHLAEKALSVGIEVTVVDDLSTSKGRNVPEDVDFVEKSIEDFATDERFDYVVHLAARPSPEDYISNPVSTILSNSSGTKVMLDIAKRSNARFMYTSSSEVYGDAHVIPTPEDYFGYVNPNGIRSCYDEGKRFSEALIMAYHRQFGLDTRIQRPFNVYGARIREDGLYGRVIPRFIDQSLNNWDVTVHGSGQQTRSFLYIEDWIDATWSFLTYDNLSGQVLNIGANAEVTMLELANLIKDMCGSQSTIVHTERREEDPSRRAADLSKAYELINWKPIHELKDGLRNTIEWFKERKK